MAETFSYDRASFAERAAKLAGMTTFREPVGGRGTKRDQTPDEHTIAAAFAYARKMVWDERLGEYIPDKHDIGPEIAVAIITGTHAHGDRIIRELAAALMAGLGKRAEGHATDILRIAAGCYLWAVSGERGRQPDGMEKRQYQIAHTLGDRILWQAAEESLFRAERAYRQEAIRVHPETRLNPSSA